MSDTTSSETARYDKSSQLLTELCLLVRERAESEAAIKQQAAAASQQAEQSYQQRRRELENWYQHEKQAAQQGYISAREKSLAEFQSQYEATLRQYEAELAAAQEEFDSQREAAKTAYEEARWEITAMSEAARGGSNLELKDILAGLEARWEELHQIHSRATELLQQWGQWYDIPPAEPVQTLLEQHPAHRFERAVDTARKQMLSLSGLMLPRLTQGLRPLMALAGALAILIYPVGSAIGWHNWPWLAGGVVVVLGIYLVVISWLNRLARQQAIEGYVALRRTLLEAGFDKPAVLQHAKLQCEKLYQGIYERQNAESQRALEKFTATMKRLKRRYEQRVQDAEKTFPPRLKELEAQRDRLLAELDAGYPQRVEQLEQTYRARSQELSEAHEQACRQNQLRFERQWQEMAERWRLGMERFDQQVAELAESCRQWCPNFQSLEEHHLAGRRELPPVVSFGQATIRLADIPNGVPEDERLMPPRQEYSLPLVLPFPQRSLVLFKVDGPGRNKAIEAMQAVMLRLLVAAPPGRIRLTVIDPVGLGEDFSTFMHLADYDEQLIASRIWTESTHIEQRLADITKHMEDVIQVYLRKEFSSIAEYNAFAGEMAEPYRVLAVANFPTNFSEAAANRLKSIVASGARCGVFALVSVDVNMPMPPHFHLPDVEQEALVLRWKGEGFVWEHPLYGQAAVSLEQPPPTERFRELVRAVGSQAKDVGRVEVPFACTVPPSQQWWTADSTNGIDVPLGRVGAMKLQHLDLGKGTSQHVLVAGKTGSGKSTLLHVLITNLSIRYSPDQVELYLVDFKKGVEFKAYSRYQLPHARVVAIESEREFGLSVLQRLDGELRQRGDLFRKHGVQDIRAFRAAQPQTRMPRILLIIDEFQEFFVEDDRIAQEAALLLDRLVRQGRAFGIHVLLGSQTLGGAYTLARSTIGQMAVRIALQCSESDAHLILSEDNTAARLLTRPGEAIYNDANGLYEGNHPFQVVWLPDHERDEYLQQILHLATERGVAAPKQIVFEGNALADLHDNPALQELLELPAWPSACTTPQAWLGAAVAIKEPTAAGFVRHNGSNLLVVGHRDESALGVLAASLLSLALQHPADGNSVGQPGARFYLLDGTRPDAPEVGYLNRLAAAVPHETKICGPRGASALVAEVAAELERRQTAGQEAEFPVYLFIYNLGRFRDLRKEDSFGFSGYDDSQSNSPAAQFSRILRDGPAHGIHTIAWCDTYVNLQRMVDRQGLQEFEMRVLFQMNATDSSCLMDSPDASRLGVYRAIFVEEGQGRIEKFRPYAPPGADFLALVRQKLHSRLPARKA